MIRGGASGASNDRSAGGGSQPKLRVAIYQYAGRNETPADRIVRTMEDAWDLLRRERGALPRQVNFVSGPSRTADIEMTLVMGAHGPFRVHIVLLGS